MPVLTAPACVPVGRAFKYGLAGLFGTAVYFASVAALVEWMRVPPVPAAALATVVVTFVSYAINRWWVSTPACRTPWRSRASSPPRC